MNTDAFLLEIPKYDIHVHLDGSLRIPTLIELAREYNVELPTYNEEELRKQVFNGGYQHLPDYLEGFKYTTAVMQTAQAVERISYEFAVDNYSEGVRYFEVRFAPQLCASIDPEDNFNLTEVMCSCQAGLTRATNEFNLRLMEEKREHEPRYDFGIIACAIRGIFPGMSRYYDALFAIHQDTVGGDMTALASELLVRNIIHCRENCNMKIVAIDIAGAEDGFENKCHRKAYEIAHEYLLSKTVHAGEGFGPESIAQAVKHLHTDRIGHGFHLFNTEMISQDNACNKDVYVQRLVKHVCDRRIAFEVCLTSNLDTMPTLTIDQHAFKDMLANNVSITLNTDNRLMSNTTTIKELKLAIETFKLTNKQLKEIVICGFKRSFYHGSYADRRAYVRKVMNYYDEVAAKHGVK